jgi:hypothetical protein
MQDHLLSDTERKLLTEYISNGKREPSGRFRMLKLRILKNFDTLESDFELIKKAKVSFGRT